MCVPTRRTGGPDFNASAVLLMCPEADIPLQAVIESVGYAPLRVIYLTGRVSTSGGPWERRGQPSSERFLGVDRTLGRDKLLS